MDTKKIFGFILMVLLLLPWNVFSQYTDHRNRQVDSLEQVLLTNPVDKAELRSIYRGLMAGYRQIDVDKSMEYARLLVAIVEGTEYPKVLSEAYSGIGIGYYKKSQYDSALIYYNKALEAIPLMKNYKKYTEKERDDYYSAAYGQIGNLYNMQGLYHEAIEYYTKALEIFEKYGWKESQAIAYSNIGEMYMAMDNYEEAKVSFTSLDALAHDLNDSLFIAYAKEKLGAVSLYERDYVKALENAEIAYRYFAGRPEEEGEKIVVLLNLLSRIYLDGYNNENKAEEYVRQALALLENMDIPSEKAVSLWLLSHMHLRRGQWRQAEQTALEALAADDSEPANTMALYQILSKACAYLGNAAKSAEYFDKHNALQASYSNKHYQSAIREMEVKYETEKKETRIVTLEEERRLIFLLGIAGGAVLLILLILFVFLWRWSVQKKRATEQRMEQEKRIAATQALLDGEVQERTRLARDLHDGLGSMLTGTRMNIEELRNDALQGKIDIDRFNNTLKILNDSSRELRRVAHHLMPDSLSRFGLKTSVSDFCHALTGISFSWYGDDMRLEPKLEAMIYRTIHELVNNALKHARASQILVQIIQEPGRIAFTVQDDGCGFDPLAPSAGMGLTNIRNRVASFGGIISIVSTVGEGTEINIEIKIENHDTGSDS